MAVTQADVDALQAVVDSGVLEVRFDGPPMRLVRYQSSREMKNRLAEMKRELAGASATTFVATRKGF